jgi:hypothetical protein
MTTIIQQPVGALFMKRLDDGRVEVAIRQGRVDAGLAFSQRELHTLYLTLGAWLVGLDG